MWFFDIRYRAGSPSMMRRTTSWTWRWGRPSNILELSLRSCRLITAELTTIHGNYTRRLLNATKIQLGILGRRDGHSLEDSFRARSCVQNGYHLSPNPTLCLVRILMLHRIPVLCRNCSCARYSAAFPTLPSCAGVSACLYLL